MSRLINWFRRVFHDWYIANRENAGRTQENDCRWPNCNCCCPKRRLILTDTSGFSRRHVEKTKLSKGGLECAA